MRCGPTESIRTVGRMSGRTGEWTEMSDFLFGDIEYRVLVVWANEVLSVSRESISALGRRESRESITKEGVNEKR